VIDYVEIPKKPELEPTCARSFRNTPPLMPPDYPRFACFCRQERVAACPRALWSYTVIARQASVTHLESSPNWR
jgi:hypothetical protein